MAGSTGGFVATLVVGVVAVLVVGQLLRRAAHDYLEEVYGDRTRTTSLNTLLLTLFHLLALGLLTMVARADLGLDSLRLVVARTGIFLLVLGGVYALALLGLSRARSHRRDEDAEDDFRGRGR
jgi:hypothetical protein